MFILLIVLGTIALAGIGSTLVQVVRDGYGRVPDRPELFRPRERDYSLERGLERGLARDPGR